MIAIVMSVLTVIMGGDMIMIHYDHYYHQHNIMIETHQSIRFAVDHSYSVVRRMEDLHLDIAVAIRIGGQTKDRRLA